MVGVCFGLGYGLTQRLVALNLPALVHLGQGFGARPFPGTGLESLRQRFGAEGQEIRGDLDLLELEAENRRQEEEIAKRQKALEAQQQEGSGQGTPEPPELGGPAALDAPAAAPATPAPNPPPPRPLPPRPRSPPLRRRPRHLPFPRPDLPQFAYPGCHSDGSLRPPMSAPQSLFQAAVNRLTARLGSGLADAAAGLAVLAQEAPERLQQEWQMFWQEVELEAERIERGESEPSPGTPFTPGAAEGGSAPAAAPFPHDPQEQIDALRAQVAALARRLDDHAAGQA